MTDNELRELRHNETLDQLNWIIRIQYGLSDIAISLHLIGDTERSGVEWSLSTLTDYKTIVGKIKKRIDGLAEYLDREYQREVDETAKSYKKGEQSE